MPILKGFRYFQNGPRLHEYLNEFRRDVLDKYDCFVIGEAPMMTPKKALKFISEESERSLDAMFNFQHMEADCLFIEYLPRPFKLRKLKRAFSRWQKELYGKGWNALYLENHDHPRIINRYGNENYREKSGKMLAVSFLFQQGTPFIYQGQEIGMTNITLDSIDKYKDCVAINRYNIGIKKKPKEKMLALIQHATRDSARTPMQWSGEANGGFSSAEPWFDVNPNYPEVNVHSQENDPDSLLNFYRALIKYRNGNPVIRHGTYKEHNRRSSDLYIYSREYKGKRLLIICSFTEKSVIFNAPHGFDLSTAKLLFCNYDNAEIQRSKFVTQPYETRVYELSR
jgi:oligo-1,6-glucosidase